MSENAMHERRDILGFLRNDRLTPRQRLAHKLRDGTYRARKYYHLPTATLRVRDALHLLDTDVCYYCGKDVTGYYELEHKSPLSRGGPHEIGNLCKACGFCNEHKGEMDEAEFKIWLAGHFSKMQEPMVERMDAWDAA